MLVLKCTEYQTLNIYHTEEITSTNNVENTSIKLTTLNVMSKSVAMNCKMNDERNLVYKGHVGHDYTNIL